MLAKPATSVRNRPVSISGLVPELEFPVNLHDIVIVHQRGAVELVGFDGADLLGLLDRPVRKLAGRPEFKTHAVVFDGQGLAQIAQQKRDEDVVGGNIQQGSFPRALTHRRKCIGIVTLAIEAHPLDLQGQYVTRRDVKLCRFKKGKPGPVVANVAKRNGGGQGRMNGRRRTFRIPAGSGQMPGQYIAFEDGPGAGQRNPGCAERYDEGFEFGHDARHDVLGLVAFAELKPVEAIRRQRDHIRQLADRREAGATQHFQRNAVLPGRKIEFGGLRRSGQVGDTENDLIAELPDVSEHRAVDRADERHAAAAERQRRLAHRNQPFGRAQQ